MATRKLNRLASQVAQLTSKLPPAYKPWGYTFAFDSMVRCALRRVVVLFLPFPPIPPPPLSPLSPLPLLFSPPPWSSSSPLPTRPH